MMQEQFQQALFASDVKAVSQLLPLEPGMIDAKDACGVKLSLRAAERCNADMLRYLVEYGLKVNLNDVDDKGRDMLHYAAQSGDVEKCRYLVEWGGMNPLRGDKRMETPFDVAHHGGHAALEAYFAEKAGAPWQETYHNPVRSGFYPDPSVVRVGDTYYMVNSTFTFFPCIPVSKSTDLVHWQTIGHAIVRPEWAHLEGLEGGRGWWAPDISYDNGRFYICATLRLNDVGAVRRRQMVVSSTRPEGPYSEPVFIDEDGIDPSIFHDDDGRHYMLLNRGARMFELNADCTRMVSAPKLLHYGNHGRAPEGAHLMKHDGWYYLFQAEGGTGMGHRETVSRSKSLGGPYVPSPYNPVIRQWDERSPLQRCGHAKPVSGPDGRWFFVYLCGRALDGKWTMLGRETALDSFTWTPDGWPLMNQGQGPSIQAVAPYPRLSVAQEMQSVSDWMTPRPPHANQIVWQEDGVTVQGDACPMTDTACRSVLLRRQTSFDFSFRATVTVPEMGEAGITCYYDERAFLTLGVREGQVVLHQQMGSQCEKTDSWSVNAKPGSEITLVCRTHGLSREMYLYQGGTHTHFITLPEVTYLSDEGIAEGKRFTGAMVGVYALGTTGVFRHMTYREEDV